MGTLDTATVHTLVGFLAFQLCLLPIQLISWWGLHKENKKKEHLLKTCLRALGMIVVTRGKGGSA